MAYRFAGDHRVFLSLLPANAGEKRLAIVVTILSLLVFASLAPFAKVPLAPVAAFIPAYQAPLALNDLLTSILLFGQFSITRSRGLLLLASAYLFTALMVAAHLASFPGAFAPAGLFGSGPQTTAWLYLIWHAGFPILVAAYAVFDRSNGEISLRRHGAERKAGPSILISVVLVAVTALGALLLTTVGHGLLPPVMAGNRMAPAIFVFIGGIMAMSLVALGLLWRRKPHCVLDLWLMVAMCAWLTDIALSALLNAGRFDLGFYAGRVYGLAAASFVLVVLLLEARTLYSQLARSLEAERAEAERRREEVELANRALRESENRLQLLNDTLEQRVHERSRLLEIETGARAHAQEALREAQKLEAIGRMAGGIAHDFNNLLTIILGAAELLQSQSQSATDIATVKGIERAAERGAQLIRQILVFSHRQSLNPEAFDLRHRAADLAEMLERSVRGDVQVVVNLAEDLWVVECDAAELELALMNLCVNARDAMAVGGLIRIEGRNVALTEEVAANSNHDLISSPHVAGDFVAISLSDSGTGIPLDTLVHVFEPFFTTKEIGKGTGLGLSQVYGFAQQTGGRVAIDSKVGSGTKVTIYLPRAIGAPAAKLTPDGEPRATGKGTILLVEDDEQVARMAVNLLATLGYQAQLVMDARSALALLLGGRRYDLVFSDIVMPGGMSGVDLAHKIRQHFPLQPVLLATGFSRAAADVHQAGLNFIAKPYRADSLAKAIESAIHRRQEASAEGTG